MIVWMDTVDEGLKEINKEASSAQEYERLKDKFLVRLHKITERKIIERTKFVYKL